MSAKILNGKDLAEKKLAELSLQIAKHKKAGLRMPGLAVILVGNDPASEIYVRKKNLACQRVGIHSQIIHLDTTISQLELLNFIDTLNQDPTIDGILIQLPLPTHLDKQVLVERIRPDKDVDGLHPYNLGRLAQKFPVLRSCTPAGVMELIHATGVPIKGLNATVVGVSNLVGRPMILELLLAGCTVTACHSATKDLEQAVRNADILVAATGKPALIKGHWIKMGAIVIDVGTNRIDNDRLVGDVEFDEAVKRAGWITPVPGGVGPMTVASLLTNTLYAYKTLHLGLES